MERDFFGRGFGRRWKMESLVKKGWDLVVTLGTHFSVDAHVHLNVGPLESWFESC